MTPHLPPYPTYKPSGVGWLGDLPAHWEVRRLRTVAEMRVSNVDKHVKDGEQSVRLCNYVDVYKNDCITEDIAFMQATATAAEIERFRLEGGDVLVTKDSETWNDIGVPALVEHTAEDLVCGYHLALLRPAKRVLDGAYLLRSLQSPTIGYQFHVSANGVTRYGLTHIAIKSVQLPLPPLPEQRAIVRYLDHVDRRIQRYIEAKEQLIALLQEARQSIIQRAVTRGLDPDVPLKPSGVEWLGDVPTHWEVTATKRHYAIQLGKMLQSIPKRPDDVEVPYLKALHVQWFDVLTSDVPTMWANHRETHHFGIEPGDLLVCEGGEGGRCAILNEQIDNCIIQNALHRVRPREHSLNVYLQYVMSTVAAIGWFDAINDKATIAHFTKEKFDALRIPVPPLAEQRVIAVHLDQATAAIDSAIDNARRQSERMAEYRASLIAHVVTGKLDVRAAAAQLPADNPAETPVPKQEKIV